MSYWKLNEDPFYDEDGVLIDEDAEWQDSDEAEQAELERPLYVGLRSDREMELIRG